MAEEIVERLKAEGQLTRNTGTNSIREVRIQMDRFESIFETISEQVTMQTRLLADLVETSMDQLKNDAETDEREKARQEREDLADAQEETKKDSTKDDPDDEKSKKEGPGLLSMLSGIGITKLLFGGAAIAGFGFAAYNILKGFIDEKTGGKFTEFEQGLIDTVKGINFQSIKEKFDTMVSSLEEFTKTMKQMVVELKVTLEDLVKKLATLTDLLDSLIEKIQSLVENAIWTILPGIGLGIAIKLARLRNELKKGRLLDGLDLDGADRDSDSDSRRNKAKPSLWQKIKKFATKAAEAAAPAAASAASTAAPFAPLAVAMGTTALMGNATVEYKDLLEQYPELAGLSNGAGPGLTQGRYLTENPELMRQAIDLAKSEGTYRLETATPTSQPQTATQLLPLTERPTEDPFAELEDYLRQNPTNSSSNTDLDKLYQDLLQGELENYLNNSETGLGYRRGTKGFQDFGPASFAILHGREAVVPEETPAGRFLEQFFNEDWSPKMSQVSSMADNVATAAAGAVNMPVIINNSPTVAPIINNVQGGPNINSTSIFGSGGGDRSRNPYGITNSAN